MKRNSHPNKGMDRKLAKFCVVLIIGHFSFWGVKVPLWLPACTWTPETTSLEPRLSEFGMRRRLDINYNVTHNIKLNSSDQPFTFFF